MLGDDTKTHRGFKLVEFSDANGHPCSLQQSSAIGDGEKAMLNPGSSLVWLGVDDAKPIVMKSQAESLGLNLPPGEVSGWMPYPMPSEVQMSTRMHLDRKQVKGLVKRLKKWLKTGEFNDN